MTGDLPDWPRSQYQPGGAEAFLFFAVYGRFTTVLQIPGAVYRTAGLPAGITIRKLSRAQSPEFPFSTGPIGELLQPKQPALFAALQEAPECAIIQGAVPDPSNLNYLRDTVGLVMFFLENGGVAVMDPQQFKLYDAARWRAEIFEPEPPHLNRHVVILVSEERGHSSPAPGVEEEGAEGQLVSSLAPPAAAGVAPTAAGRLWIHTRGLHKFGRPDLSVRHVPRGQQVAAIELCNRFIQLQAQGGLISEGQEIRMASLPPGLVCHHTGRIEDPDFNNVHVEMRWPVEADGTSLSSAI